MNKNSLAKSEFIGKYLDKKLKGHGLPMGGEYFNLLEKHSEDAEKKWKAKIKKRGE